MVPERVRLDKERDWTLFWNLEEQDTPYQLQ